MAFSAAIVKRTVFGDKRVHYGTWTSGGTTGGDIATGLNNVDFMLLTQKGSAVTTNAPVLNEALPVAPGSAITIVTDSGVDGYWMAVGS